MYRLFKHFENKLDILFSPLFYGAIAFHDLESGCFFWAL